MTPVSRELQAALDARIEATENFMQVAQEEIEVAAKARYPTATYAVVTAILDESYTEHSIVVKDDDGIQLNDDDWPYEEGLEDWLMLVSEGACGFGDAITIVFSDTDCDVCDGYGFTGRESWLTNAAVVQRCTDCDRYADDFEAAHAARRLNGGDVRVILIAEQGEQP